MRRTGPDKATREEVFARANYRCERCHGPLGPWSSIHHRLPRRSGGTRNPLINHPQNLTALCVDCHLDIESHRLEAYETGWLVHAGIDPRTVTPIPLDAA